MSQLKKAMERLCQEPRDYTYDEASSLLHKLGFREDNKGKTSGSRVRFFRETDSRIYICHKPHPRPTMPGYAVKQLKDFLESIGALNE